MANIVAPPEEPSDAEKAEFKQWVQDMKAREARLFGAEKGRYRPSGAPSEPQKLMRTVAKGQRIVKS